MKTIAYRLFAIAAVAVGVAMSLAFSPLLGSRLVRPGAADDGASRQRLTPAETGAVAQTGPGAGTSGVTGIETRVLKGDPSRAGLYTIQLQVPANTRIEAHQHPDDRTATVVSGTWYFGYGDRFAEEGLKPLPPGSFYTEPPQQLHFARTGNRPVVLQISGYGPTGTDHAGNPPLTSSSR